MLMILRKYERRVWYILSIIGKLDTPINRIFYSSLSRISMVTIRKDFASLPFHKGSLLQG